MTNDINTHSTTISTPSKITDPELFNDTLNTTFDDVDKELTQMVADCYYDPYKFVMTMFDWDYGELEGFEGPDTWQRELLQSVGRQTVTNAFDGVTPCKPIREATTSGHGIGKSAITSWLVLWIMATRPYCRGTVTANTATQLSSKTWAEIGKWHSRCMVGHWFDYSSSQGHMRMSHKSWPKEWFVQAQTCQKENSEAFAGQHAANSTSFYIFDEGSAIDDIIYEVSEGGLTDGEPMHFVFGNPTRNDGRFAELFMSKNWNTRQIDSRDCKMTNKILIEEWREEHGENSDFFKVRVKGHFPSAGDTQFIPSDAVDTAMQAPIPPTFSDDPLIMAFDVARGGGDDCRIAFRRGKDARSEGGHYKITYENSKDSMVVVSKIVMIVERHKPDIILVDETGVGGPVLDRLRQLGHNVMGVHFGGTADRKDRYVNKTSEMAYRLRQWLLDGGRLPNDQTLKRELISRNFDHDKKDRLHLEAKKDMKLRLGYSPDWADAIYMLFALATFPLLANSGNHTAPHARRSSGTGRDDDPLA